MKHLLLTLLALAAGLAGAKGQQTGNGYREDNAGGAYCVEVTYAKTLHILFPAAVKYVDLGSNDIIAGKADGADNVVRIKAAVKDFEGETNFSVITADGVFYTFNAVYSDNPAMLSIQMEDWLTADPYNPSCERQKYIRIKELGDQTPLAIARAMYDIYRCGARHIKTVGSKRYGIQALLRGVYVQDELFYFSLSVRNSSKVNFDVDRLRFRITDRKAARRTAQQETFIEPLREYIPLRTVKAWETVRNVYVFRKFTIPDDKILIVDIFELGGSRQQSFIVQNADLVNARTVNSINRR